jgi:hypothetical protein
MPVSVEFQRVLNVSDERSLIVLLRTLQVRLGTPQEETDDVDRATAVMHQLNNLRTVRLLAQDAFPPGSESAPSQA